MEIFRRFFNIFFTIYKNIVIDIFIILYTFEKILITVDFESSKCLKIYTMFQHVVPGLISFVSCFACVYRYFIFSWVRISILSSSSTKSWFKTHCYEIESLKLSIIYINKKNHNPRSNPYPILNYSILKYMLYINKIQKIRRTRNIIKFYRKMNQEIINRSIDFEYDLNKNQKFEWNRLNLLSQIHFRTKEGRKT